MKRPNITPGKWNKNSFTVSGPIGDRIADCNASTGKSDAEKEANARAVAALPDLLAALEHMHTLLNSPPPNKPGGVSREKIKSALIKAGYTF